MVSRDVGAMGVIAMWKREKNIYACESPRGTIVNRNANMQACGLNVRETEY